MPVRTPVRRLAAALVLLASGAGHLHAQAATRPDFKSLRFDENWSLAPHTARWDDRIKAVPLAGARPITLTVGGQVRWRAESFRAFNTSAQDDDNAQSRLLLSADLQAGTSTGPRARMFGELRDAQSFGRNLPGGTRPGDADRHDVQNLFVDLGVGRSFVRVGRQEIALNRERLFGVPDWTNTRRGAQGVRAQITRGAITAEVIDGRPVTVRQTFANRADSTNTFRTYSLGSAAGAKTLARGLPAVWQVYRYEQRLSGTTAVQRFTTGGRVQWQANAKSRIGRSVEFEGARQTGHAGAKALAAWFWVLETQLQAKRWRGAPTVALGVEEASGEQPSTAARAEAFTVLYPAAHAHGGYADVIGRANVRELHAIVTWSPWRSLELRPAFYRFDRLRTDDGVWTKQNTVLRAASGSTGRHAADEIDLTGTWKVSRHWRAIAGGALVAPGVFLRSTPGGARTEHWGFIGSAFTF